MSAVREKSRRFMRILIAALFIATLLLSFSRDVAYANGEITHCFIFKSVHGLDTEGGAPPIRTRNFKLIETPKKIVLKCHFDYSGWVDSWPDKPRIVKGFECELIPTGLVTYNSRAVVGLGGKIVMTCFFPNNGS